MKARSLQSLLTGYSNSDQDMIRAARTFAEVAHQDQKRKSGDPYISHPLTVAQYAAGLGMDAETVAAALLHDVVEDTSFSLDDIKNKFGESIAGLVDGVTKLGEVDYNLDENTHSTRHATSVENLRKLLLAMSKDLRVIIIKLLDRLHNLQTLQYLPLDHRVRISEESLAIFAPLADRLGMGAIKAEIEDLSFKYAKASAHELTKRLVATRKQDSLRGLDDLKQTIKIQLIEAQLSIVAIDARQKHLYSIYKKLQKTEGDITKIYDLVALRIIVPSVQDCYQALGILHMHYKPLIHRIKDYIAVPKPNGYRSLHTTVIAPDGTILEIQVRTQVMHDEAEYGLAAHALYNMHKDTKAYRSGKQTQLAKPLWLEDLAQLSNTKQSFGDLVEDLKIDLFQDRIFVFTPHGDLYDLPEEATPIDFAFAIHTGIGLRAQGAKVNNRLVPLDKKLENRDIVEILTKKTEAPNRQWLSFVKTAQARTKIKAHFRAQSKTSNTAQGKALLEQKLKSSGVLKIESIPAAMLHDVIQSFNQRDIEGLYMAIGEGNVNVVSAVRRLIPQVHKPARPKAISGEITGRPVVVGASELPCTLASCCKPVPPEAITGYITRGSGITVHRLGCGNIATEQDRLLECEWEMASGKVRNIYLLKITNHSRVGMMRDITAIIAALNINIVKSTSIENEIDQKYSQIQCLLEVGNPMLLTLALRQLRQIKDVVSAEIVDS